jgi:hypothetical protein
VGVGVGAGGETGAEVRRITGSAPSEFPPKLLTLQGLLLGTEGEFEPLAGEINEEACSGLRVVVVGGRVSESGGVDEATCPGADDVPLIPWVLLLFPPSPVLLAEKGKLVLPRDVQLFAMSVWIPVAAIIEAALFGLVHAMNWSFRKV